jgi:hypothetical protein
MAGEMAVAFLEHTWCCYDFFFLCVCGFRLCVDGFVFIDMYTDRAIDCCFFIPTCRYNTLQREKLHNAHQHITPPYPRLPLSQASLLICSLSSSSPLLLCKHVDGFIDGIPVSQEMDVTTVASKIRTGKRRDEVTWCPTLEGWRSEGVWP